MLGELFSGAGGTVVGELSTSIIRHIYHTTRNQRALTRVAAGGVRIDPIEQVTEKLAEAFSKAGLLNEATERAIRRMASLGLVGHLLDAAAAVASPDYTFELMRLLLKFDKSNLPPNFEQNFFRVISEIATQLWRLQDRTEKKRVEQRFRNTESQIARLLKTLEGQHETLGSAALQIEALGDYEHFMNVVAEGTRIALDEIDIHGASGEISKASLNSIFVDCPVHPIARSDVAGFRERMQSDLNGYQSHHQGWRGILSLGQRIVLLGDPGGGKSTHSRKMCCEIASVTMDDHFIMPLFLQLRTYAAAKKTDSTKTLYEFVLRHVRDMCMGSDKEDVEKYFLYNLSVGRAFIVFDGLDEVLSDAARLEISKEISALTRKFVLSTFVITSRFVGYEVAPLDSFTHVAIGRLDPNSVAELYRKVSAQILGMDTPAINRKLKTFLQTANEKARELISNPLLLTLIIIVENKKREIPDNRADLYAMCADLLFDRWDRLRDITPDLPERYRLYDLLVHLAHKLYEDDIYGGRVKRDSLFKITKDFFMKDYVDNKEGRASEAAAKFVEHLTGRAWILHEVGENIFEFTHRTFLEYFYAKYLEANYEGTSEIFSAVEGSIVAGQKTVPTHLAFQIRTKDNRQASSRLAGLIADSLQRHHSMHLVEFSAQAARYLLPTADELDLWIGRICEESIRTSHVAPLIVLFRNDGPLGDAIRSRLCASLSSVDGIPKLAKLQPLFSQISEKLRFNSVEAQGLRAILKTAIFDRFSTLQARSPFVTKLFFDLGFPTDFDALSRHGTKIWSNNQSGYGSDERLSDALMMLRGLLGGDDEGGRDLLPYKTLAMALVKDGIPLAGNSYEIDPYRMSRVVKELRIDLGDLHSLTAHEFRAVSVSCLIVMECLSAYSQRNDFNIGINVKRLIEVMGERPECVELKDAFVAWVNDEFSLFRNKYYFTPRKLVIEKLSREQVN